MSTVEEMDGQDWKQLRDSELENKRVESGEASKI